MRLPEDVGKARRLEPVARQFENFLDPQAG